MSARGGLVTGLLGLTLLEVVVSNTNGAAGRVGGVFDAVAGIFKHWLDPSVPLIPDLSAKKSSSSSGSDPGHIIVAN